MGLYRNDGLFTFRKIKKNSKQIDVKFNLDSNTNPPYKKPNDKLIYIDVSSHH